MKKRVERALYVTKTADQIEKRGCLDCKVYEPEPTEPLPQQQQQQFLKRNTEVRGLVLCLWSSLESEPGSQEETVDGESKRKRAEHVGLKFIYSEWFCGALRQRVSFNLP